MGYSTTQIANYTGLAGMLVIALNYFGVDIAEEEAVALIGGIATAAALIVSLINRHRKGDVTVTGKLL